MSILSGQEPTSSISNWTKRLRLRWCKNAASARRSTYLLRNRFLWGGLSQALRLLNRSIGPCINSMWVRGTIGCLCDVWWMGGTGGRNIISKRWKKWTSCGLKLAEKLFTTLLSPCCKTRGKRRRSRVIRVSWRVRRNCIISWRIIITWAIKRLCSSTWGIIMSRWMKILSTTYRWLSMWRLAFWTRNSSASRPTIGTKNTKTTKRSNKAKK